MSSTVLRDGVPGGHKRERQRAILELIARQPIASQEELAERLGALGFSVTQATVSRDVAELGLVKVGRADRHVYVSPADLPAPAPATFDGLPAPDRRLRRLLEDVPVSVARSGLTLVLRARPGMANAVAQAIDESTLDEQVGTVAGDDTLLVLFADEAGLLRWRERFAAFQAGLRPSPTPPVTTEASR
ncbi:MAG TPA: hypothetical protein VF763_09530 [Candidatus Limnocylindrales bacterium]